MNVVIIDSGVSKNIIPDIYQSVSVMKKDKDFSVDESYEDEVGHGTAVAQLFLNNIEKKELLNIYAIRLVSDSIYGYDMEVLLHALDYIEKRISFDLLVLCAGIRTYNHTLHCRLKNLYERGTIIFSAFDNSGSMSYPAAFDCVVGVDVSDEIKMENDCFIGLKNNPINIITRNKAYKVKWINNKTNIVKGSSFACADIAGRFANYFILGEEKNIKNSYLKFMSEYSNYLINNTNEKKQKNNLGHCKKAVVFPFNKEIHSIAVNEDLLTMNIVDYYDIRQSGKINIEINKILHFSNNNKKIKNIEELDWESDFDTFILGHCDKFEKIFSYSLKKDIIDKCKKYNKFLISLDGLDNYGLSENSFYYPSVNETDMPCYNYGKMYMTNTPILGVFGTSSKQGKYTLQLMLRRMFVNAGYSVAQVGTEPTSVLFGMDYVFPMGYNSTVKTKSNDNLIILNEFIHGCEVKSPDIIIVGSQSGTCPYNVFNLKLFTLPQIEFLMGTQPDIVVLCVNVWDDIDYIKRTINTIEGVVDCKVIAFVLFPRRMSGNVEMISSSVVDEEYMKYKDVLEKTFSIPSFSLDILEITRLYEYIIDYLS